VKSRFQHIIWRVEFGGFCVGVIRIAYKTGLTFTWQ
jgi:hypothetical protein